MVGTEARSAVEAALQLLSSEGSTGGTTLPLPHLDLGSGTDCEQLIFDLKAERELKNTEKAIHVNKKSQSAKAKDFAVSAQMRREANAGIEAAEQRLSEIDSELLKLEEQQKGSLWFLLFSEMQALLWSAMDPAATDQSDAADREDNGAVSRKALKRKARAEQRAEWKAAQKAKKKRGSHRPKGPVLAPLDPNASEAEIKAARAARKTAELEEFRARAAKGATVVEWEEMMQPKELKSLIQQLLYCYGANRRAQQPVQLCFSGVEEGSKTHEGLSKQSGYESWEEKLIYLTADAEEKLESFEPEMVYVIGGIVDRNRHKGCTIAKAREQGIRSAHLPLADYIDMGNYSRVLTVNHVLNMILDHQLSRDWRGTCERCVPGRKLLHPEEADVESAGERAEREDAADTTG
eukprot:s1711_g5.t3